MATLSFCSLPTNLDWSQAKLLHQWWHAYIFLSSDYIVFKSLPDTILLTLVPIIFFCNRILYIEILKFLIEKRYLLLILSMEKKSSFYKHDNLETSNVVISSAVIKSSTPRRQFYVASYFFSFLSDLSPIIGNPCQQLIHSLTLTNCRLVYLTDWLVM